ncbi:MAG TPA: PepSY domain-containing protein [Rhodocyclaceae bacterium]|nr:PepSY domain-containing protein [Rhodocyclaceae bacterium]
MPAQLLRLVLIGFIALASPFVLAIDRDEAAARAQQLTSGRVLAVEAASSNGEPVFVVRVLTPSGDVVVVVIDAQSGAVRR